MSGRHTNGFSALATWVLTSFLIYVMYPPPRADGAFFFYLDLNRLASALLDEGRVGVTDDVASWLLKQTNVACVAGDAFGDVNGLRLIRRPTGGIGDRTETHRPGAK